MPKLSFAEKRKIVLQRQRERTKKDQTERRRPTALQRYAEAGIPWNGRPANFAPIKDYELQFPFSDEGRRHFLETFAEHRKETLEQVVRMVGDMAQSTGLTFDELLFQHYHNGWHGPQTVSERQRNAAYKAWDTMRARKAAEKKNDD